MTPESPTMIPSTDGVRVAVHDFGGPDDPGAPVLLMSHATGFHGRVWGPMASSLTARFRCVAVDYRGHGLAEMPPGTELAWSGVGDDALAVLGSGLLGDRVVHGVGHSMGGAALVLAAARRPGILRSLWLYEPVLVPPGMLPPATQRSGNSPMSEAAARRRGSFASYDEAYANFAAKPPLNELHPDALRAYVMGGFAPEPAGTVGLLCRPETEADVYRGAADSGAWEVLPGLEIPVAIVAGRPGGLGPVAFAPLAAERLPRATLIARPHLGHFGPLEEPAAMAADVEAWVDAHR